MRHEFPWIRGGPIHAVAEDVADWFETELRRLGFELIRLDGSTMIDEPAFWLQIKTGFRFPDYQGSNWDAFNDSFGDLDLPPRLVVVWRNADAFAERNLKLFAEAAAILVESFRPLQTCQGIVVLTGNQLSFARPAAT